MNLTHLVMFKFFGGASATVTGEVPTFLVQPKDATMLLRPAGMDRLIEPKDMRLRIDVRPDP